jgi:uncharacterized protein (DUF433 family)
MITRQTLHKLLFQISESKIPSVELRKISRKLTRAYLNFGSETPCNLEAMRHIEFGWARNCPHGPKNVCGLKITTTNTTVTDILWNCETDEIVALIHKERPDLTKEQIASALRVATLTLSALEIDSN